jgi:hypothetical protein
MRCSIVGALWLVLICSGFSVCEKSAFAQQPQTADAPQTIAVPAVLNRPYDGLTAGAEAYLNAEAQRRQNIARQLDHVERITWSLGLPNRSDGVVWYRDPPSLDYVYAYGQPVGAAYVRRPAGPLFDVFEPWPRVPGDIFGYPDPAPIRQPLGHISTQTGPNRWEYHPIYAEDLLPATGPRIPQLQANTYSGANAAAQPPAARVVPPPPQPARDTPPAAGPRVF